MKTLILGIGNEIRGDDGIGIYLAGKMKGMLDPEHYDVRTTHAAGMIWLDMLEGYEKAVIIDAVVSDTEDPGTVVVIKETAFKKGEDAFSVHKMGLADVLDAGRKIGVKLPEDLKIVGVYIKDTGGFSEDISEELIRVMPETVKNIRDIIQ